MCRMIFAAGKFELSQLIDNLILMAKGENEFHENNQKLGTHQHKEGWGIAYLDHGEWVVKKSEKAVFEDPNIDELRKVKTNLAVLHVRKATNGVVSYDNTHPFHFKNYVFCHNGTLRGKIDYDHWFHVDGRTDSEKLFYSILTEIKEDPHNYDNHKVITAIRTDTERYQDYTALNFILARVKESYVHYLSQDQSQYHQMKMSKSDNLVIVSSEKLNLPNLQWNNLEQGDIVTINNQTLETSIDKR
ncbi:class II glutamine amidotransferase [Candidatus Woesearchaeota archaeon]|jgi:predicted glutamine amidotransferase|nr:class II glutamine amidotransferase [Candidatus Woesearchaeota archaeon]